MKKYILTASLLMNIVFISVMIYHRIPQKEPVNTFSPFNAKSNLFAQMPVDSSSIVFIGNSHVENFQLTELFRSIHFKNRGITGESSKEVLANIRKLIKGNPNQVFIEIGTNDLFGEKPVDGILSNIQSIINEIHSISPSSFIYLQSVIANYKDAEQAIELNKRLQGLADANKIAFVDLSPLFTKDGINKAYDFGDHVHLNGIGYLKWKEILLPYIKQGTYYYRIVAVDEGKQQSDHPN